ncbi:alpha/beta hydrolase [Ammoniphilus sp. YIM 78166]|uniref:alpha/beta hydrolase n=1 Tax=Ammoniphilus sp. YIM 78166 TaxID=1644106 RepID=UPI0014320B34|nr:alpha/beta hydrolase [Ammoniphilus sp. YIM 78166]
MHTNTVFSPGKGSVWGSILLVHGSGEHVGRYQWAIEQWNKAGVDVLGGDLPGHGKSEGRRGHIHSFEEYIHAADQWYQELVNRNGQLPFVFGHSLGGLVVSRLMETKRPQVKGVLLSSPCFGLKIKVPAWKASIAQMLNVVYPTLTLRSEVTSKDVTRSEDVRKMIDSDPLNVKGVSVRWFRELETHMQKNWEERENFPDVPLLIQQAGQDLITDASRSRKWFEQLSLKDKNFIEWPGLYHELLNEPEKQEVHRKMVEWMKSRSI